MGGSAGCHPSPAPPSCHPTFHMSLPGCECGALGPPRSTRPLAICCSRGTSTAVSHDSDCRSPGRSSSLVVARSLQGGAGAWEKWGAQATSQGLPNLWNHPVSASPSYPTFQSAHSRAWVWEPGPRIFTLAARSHVLRSHLHLLFYHAI